MADTTQDVPAPKKRSFFKRAAWQDAAKKEGEDMFSHANEFKDMVAEQDRHREEVERKAESERHHKQAGQRQGKRRKVSLESEESIVSGSGSGKRKRTGSKARSRTPHSPVPSCPLTDSLAARYDSLLKSASSSHTQTPKESVVIDLDDEHDAPYNPKAFNDNNLTLDYATWNVHRKQMPVLLSKRPPVEDDEVEEILDPTLAALQAKARQRAAQTAQSTTTPTADGEPSKDLIAQLFIKPQIPDADPLLVKVRIDSTIDKLRQAWCERQGFSADMTKNVFFTWKDTRIYDSTTIKRLGMKVDQNGNVSVKGDPNIYDDVNLPKVFVEAWTEELFRQRKKEDAADAAAKKKATEQPHEAEEREPTPEPVPQVTKIRLFLKAKGKEDFRLSVNPNTTFADIAQAYKSKREIDKNQPLTLTFDGDRLSPLDIVADSEIEDMDGIEVHFK
ncbi:uncharacterized protein K460DRAFT_417004 [Cucurbitaria berberidis CBS 394.84]|uniref:Ubiquitin-like domain-containing protein n=1 Tax=Cucurbitaria berberidis CBS 394.84 TaxID=1168544 RepID=A0A9P4L934_9PLEO|nr:uncharacterized protein K460DRAFT_417004 [Cucurbitaria berberidis CBS 394.84]KAF1845809.1 hypothetical protein K460DRAFT_417004 [Cucurbitaria berberidis CBS 394.84]